MTDVKALPNSLCRRILSHLGLPADAPPDMATLQSLITRYTRTVPWESASRIMRRATYADSADCALLGVAFWESHFAHGTGGTCYESNYAFFGLLRRLGYTGYLTINDMGAAIGCHSAIALLLDDQKFLVDVGFPLYTFVPIDSDKETSASCPRMEYSLSPEGDNAYLLRRESGARDHSFTLRDQPVSDADYRAIAIHDYRHDGGQFLNEIVIQKVVDERLWRFHSDVQPLCLQEFVDGERIDYQLGGEPAAELAANFGIAREALAAAMAALGQPPVANPLPGQSDV